MVCLKLISHSKEKVTTDAQEKIRGAASGGFANEVSDHEESVATEAGYFIQLEIKASHGR
jgi:hypothetical protein